MTEGRPLPRAGAIHVEGYLEHLSTLHHRPQRVIDLVGDPCRQPTHTGHLGRLQHHLFQAHPLRHVVYAQHDSLELIGDQGKHIHVPTDLARIRDQSFPVSARDVTLA